MATNQQKTAKETNKVVNYGLNHYCSLAGINKEGQIYIVDKINDHDKRNTTKRQKTMRGQVGALVAISRLRNKSSSRGRSRSSARWPTQLLPLRTSALLGCRSKN